MRILITGARNWVSKQTICDAIIEYLEHNEPKDGLTIVHGQCPSGADKLADELAREAKINVEPHPAVWRVNGRYDPTAGFKRNAEMVELGADVCLAFLMPCIKDKCKEPKPHWCHGTSHTAKIAEEAGIEVRKFYG